MRQDRRITKFKNLFNRQKIKSILIGGLLVLISACASRYLKYDKVEELKKIDEFDQQVKIVMPESPPAETTTVSATESAKSESESLAQKKTIVEKKSLPRTLPKKLIGKEKLHRHEPSLENGEGFNGRRPIVDPFRVGEKVVHSVSWAKMNGGFLSFEVKPFAQVNGRKSYQFQIEIGTNSFFSSIYSVEDKLVSLVDFDTMVPSVFSLHVKHTTELREARAFFDQKNKKATYWEKFFTSHEGEKEKKLQWDILSYSQDVYSALFYMRTFQWRVGQTHQFRVADDNENLIFKAKALRQEKIDTAVGTFEAIVIQPQVELKGIAKPVGDIFMWISNDDRKYILRIEAKVKVGTFVTEISELKPGQLE